MDGWRSRWMDGGVAGWRSRGMDGGGVDGWMEEDE